MTATGFDALGARAVDAFTAAAVAEGLADVAVTTIATPVGALLVAAVDDAIVRVAFDVEDHDEVLVQLAQAIGSRVLEVDTPVLHAARTQLDEYFSGARSTFDLALDMRLARGPFRLEVLALLPAIPVGSTRTYAELAAIAGRPTAIRAVGSGCATNPLPIVVPCHRVLRTGGQLGGYLGGVERKQWLLDHESRLAS
ncbi:MAG: cysteine methyltransferase [Thermoleophilia bacterium]|nr:cysteine methyltransferase [Thermoleophilia bacterium]